MKNILIVCPLLRDKRELSNLAGGTHNYIFFEHRGDDLLKLRGEPQQHFLRQLPHYSDILKRIIYDVKDLKIDGVISSGDYPGSLVASLVAHELGLVGPDIEVLLSLQHKFLSRLLQQEAVPEATPSFHFINHDSSYDGPFPAFIKPIKSNFSQFADIVCDKTELFNHIETKHLPAAYLELFNEFLDDYLYEPIKPTDFLIEGLLHGQQFSLEGFVAQGEIVILGIVDAYMYPGTMSFQRFEYPSSIAETVQQRVKKITNKVINHAGLDNTFFNIEFMYDCQTDILSIIEINPRIASQFADLFEKVDGVNGYSLLTEVSLGSNPKVMLRSGDFKVAASCVLRIFDDAFVEKIPTSQEINTIVKRFPGVIIEVCCQQGEFLSQSLQDGQSFRYALVHLGAENQTELLAQLEEIIKQLNFKFKF